MGRKADALNEKLGATVSSEKPRRGSLFSGVKRALALPERWLEKIVRRRSILNSFVADRNQMYRLSQANLATAFLHQRTFLPYKAIHTGKSVALFASGPSFNKYKAIPDCIKVGVNQAFWGVPDLDYYFLMDGHVPEIMEGVKNYRRGLCKKFYGFSEYWIEEWHHAGIVSESDLIEAGASRFIVDKYPVYNYKSKFALDISSQPLGDFSSIVFPAMQFILWTNPAVIYLIGCDCSRGGHFNETGQEVQVTPYERFVKNWIELKEFARIFYPKTRIISVNPVGLKGVFEDLYQA